MKDLNNDNKHYLTWLGSNWGGLHVDLSLIPQKSTVISAGLANDISFDTELIDRKLCYIVGVDPTRLSLKTILKYRITHFSKAKNFIFYRKALHCKSGLTVSLGGPAKTFLSPTGEKVKTIAIDDLLAMYPGASFLKLDIEGAEYPVIESIAKFRVPQIAISFHAWLNSVSDTCPNEGVVQSLYTPQDTMNCIDKIKAMGYKLVYEGREHPERIGQETLFIRNDFAGKYNEVFLEQPAV